MDQKYVSYMKLSLWLEGCCSDTESPHVTAEVPMSKVPKPYQLPGGRH